MHHYIGQNGYNVNFNLDYVPMKAVQLRMARAAIGWGVRELGEKAGVCSQYRHPYRKRR